MFTAVSVSCVCVCLVQIITPVLMRSRAFMRPGVKLSLFSNDLDAIIEVDRVRLGQIITNGMRCWTWMAPLSGSDDKACC